MEDESLFRVIYTIVGSIGCGFLMMTLLIYYLIPELNNLHGMIVKHNIIANTLQTIYLIVVFNFTHVFNDILCKVIGIFGYFLTMSMFLWTAILSWDLCLTIQNGRSCTHHLIKIQFINILSLLEHLRKILVRERRHFTQSEAGVWEDCQSCSLSFLMKTFLEFLNHWTWHYLVLDWPDVS